MHPFRKYILLSCMLIFPFTLSAGTITGGIKNSQTGKPLSSVLIEVENTSIRVTSDSSGLFRIDSLKSGSWNLLFFHEKTEPLTINDVFVSGAVEKKLDVEMNPVVYNLTKTVVHGNAFRRPPDMASSTKIMSFDEVLRSPGALVDVQRAVQELPSVASGGDNTNEIIVRGGNPGENLFVMDNIDIPNPNHFADQGSGGGVISLINPLLMNGLTFCAGAPPACYGGKASSVLDVKLRDGNDKLVLGGIDLGMAGLGFHMEGPLWSNSTFMASATKSYLDLFAKYAETTAIPRYWGMQAKLTQSFSNQKLYGNFLYGNNSIDIKDALKDAGSDGDKIHAGGMVYASGATLESRWTDRFSTTITLSGTGNSFDRREFSDSIYHDTTSIDSFFINKSIEQEQTLKAQATLDLPGNAQLQIGASVKRCDFDEKIWDRPDTIGIYDSISNSYEDVDAVYKTDINSRRIAYKYAGFLSCLLFPADKIKIIPGVRADKFTYNNSFSISPRLGAVYSFTPDLDLTGAFGIQYQDPDYADLVAAPQNRDLKPKQAITGIGGIEYLLNPLSAKLVVEAFYKRYDNLPVDSSFLTGDPYDESNVLLSIGEGRSYGLEFFFQKKLTGNVFWTFAYSLSRSEMKDVRPGHEDQWYRGDYDFRNGLTLTCGYKLDLINYSWYKRLHDQLWLKLLSPVIPIADRVELSMKWRYLGGRPRTEPEWNSDFHRYVVDQENLNSSRFDDYHRLDLRLERRFGFGFLRMIYYFDLQNIYNRKNVWTYIYSDKHHTVTPIYQFQFFPAGGVIIGF